MPGTAETRLAELASHLHGELVVRDRNKAGGRLPVGLTRPDRLKGDRAPKISSEKDHLTVSWIGNPLYHRNVWQDDAKRGKFSVNYDVVVFYKSSQELPKAWASVIDATLRGLSAEQTWSDIPDNHFVALTKNDHQSPAKQAGRVNASPVTAFSVLGEKMAIQPGRWFAFPGVFNKGDFSKRGRAHPDHGQIFGWVPGAKADWSSGVKAERTRDQRKKVRRYPRGFCFFRHESDLARAIITKIYPLDPVGAWQSILLKVLWTLLGFTGLAILAAAGNWALGTACKEGLVPPEIPVCEIREWIEDRLPEIGTTQERERLESEAAAKDAKIAEMEEDLTEASGTIADQEGELADLEALLADLRSRPQGLDEPPCWLDASGKRPEFVFDVHISDAGLRVTRAAPEHRSAEFLALPIDPAALGITTTIPEFRDQFRPLYDKTRSLECRHFVRVYEGHHHEVDRYKAQRDAVESFFYIYRPNRAGI